ncbi:MAG: YkvA family protein [Pseudomonadales bacterium]
MSLEIAFTLDEEDLDYFRKLMTRAQENITDVEQKDIVSKAQALLDGIPSESQPRFVQQRFEKLQLLINMLDDSEWPLEEEEKLDISSALAYFHYAQDLIPDNIPALGYIDDAIFIELVVRELAPEIDAFEEFTHFRRNEETRRGLEDKSVTRDEWLESKRKELFQRMRRRRKRRIGGGGGRLTSFSLG